MAGAAPTTRAELANEATLPAITAVGLAVTIAVADPPVPARARPAIAVVRQIAAAIARVLMIISGGWAVITSLTAQHIAAAPTGYVSAVAVFALRSPPRARSTAFFRSMEKCGNPASS